jgi:hypothetical protein
MSNETDLDWLARNVHVWPKSSCPRLPADSPLINSGWEFSYGQVRNSRSSFTESQWLSRRAELQNKPSWEFAPEWACYLVQIVTGSWVWLASDTDLTWEADAPGPQFVGKMRWSGCSGASLGNWRDTLERRPEEFKPSTEEANKLAQQFQPFTSIEDNQEQVMEQKADQKQDNGWHERGELPPVGVECLALIGIAPPAACRIIAITREQIAVHWVENGQMDVIDLRCQLAFRPLRTEREKAITEMMEVSAENWGNLQDCCERLYDAGYRKESK